MAGLGIFPNPNTKPEYRSRIPKTAVYLGLGSGLRVQRVGCVICDLGIRGRAWGVGRGIQGSGFSDRVWCVGCQA
jgi:hypothetical protein